MKGFWSTAFSNGAQAWILEWPVSLRPVRVVMLVLDVSDSMTPVRARTRDLVTTLANQLDLGDRCLVWIAGQSECVADITLRHAVDRRKVVHAFDDAPKDRRGTWLRETTTAVDAAARPHAGNPRTRLFHLLVSDGEIFDAEALPERFYYWLPIGASEPNRLRHFAVKVTLDEIRERMTCSELDVTLSWPSEGASAWRLSSDGTIGADSVSQPARPVDGMFRLVFAGASEPALRINYAGAGAEASDAAPASAPLSGRPYGHLEDPRARREFDFDHATLAKLVVWANGGPSRAGEVRLACAYCHATHDATRKLECPVSGFSLLTRDGQRVPKGYAPFREVEILPDGRFGVNRESERRPHRGRFDVQSDSAGRQLLVLSLVP
jgi:hypothetical protein